MHVCILCCESPPTLMLARSASDCQLSSTLACSDPAPFPHQFSTVIETAKLKLNCQA